MNERVRDSHGLPLRAMVMVLLFLGVIFLLVGFNALGSDKSASSDSTTTSVAAAAPKSTPPPPAPKPDVRVYNTTSVPDLARGAADQVASGGWKVTEVGNLPMPDVNVTTVFFGKTAGEEEAAHEIAKLLAIPAAPRPPELAEQPPGVVVAVAI
ncbi:LytR C-terminal domain-containing protein [Mycobacterium sp. NPDC050853]|uniref:LytR C-terminal domain-containing protein n=1 Tax=Mycobacteriaceae TaxID=1762 RepID=UPI0015DDABE1|nr:LytR C-terminal domain-containing protein [Mycobacteroides sp. LB1]